MKVLVKKWGNSASVRIPASVMASAQMSLDQAVDVREEQGRIVIEPIHPAYYDLDELIDAMTPQNIHAEINSGKQAGKEIW